MTRTTRAPGDRACVIDAIVIPAATEITRCSVVTTGRRPSSTPRMLWGLTASTMTSLSFTTGRLESKTATPVSTCERGSSRRQGVAGTDRRHGCDLGSKHALDQGRRHLS